MDKRQITLKDIAKALNLSTSTISRALKGQHEISNKTKELVDEYAKAHNYKPNDFALSLRTNKNKNIGVIIPEIAHYFFSSVLSGIQDEAEKEDYNIIIYQSRENFQKEVKCVESLMRTRVSGILVSQSKMTSQFNHFQEIIDQNIPLVFFDRICTGINTDKVVVDDYAGAYNAVEYLISTGCKRIAFLGASPLLAISNNRRMGYENALKKYGIPVDKQIMSVCDTVELTKETIPILLKQANRPDAFFAINDEVASCCINIIKSFKLSIPKDISVCGFSNGNIAEITNPGLTTVDQRAFEMGTTTARLLINRIQGIENKTGIVSKIIKTRLVVRESTR